MLSLHRNVKSPNFVPDFMAQSVVDIDFARLKKRGVKYIAFDADSTLVHLHGTVIQPESLTVLRKARKLFADWCIASNRVSDNLHELGDVIDANVVRAGFYSRKPRKHYFKRVLSNFDAKPQEVAMVGDKLVADMWGAKRMGMVTVWVEHIGPDSWWDRLFQLRHIEALLMRSYSKHHRGDE